MAAVNAIAVIPARSGSQGLKNKNILDLCGKPVLAYSIEAALDSGCFERIIVSTDSQQYGAIAENFGAEVMYRGSDLSGSNATTLMVLRDLFNRLSETPEVFTLLQPTSPLRTAAQIRDSMDLFTTSIAMFDFLVSVTLAEHSRSLVHPLDRRGGLSEFNDDYSSYHRQGESDYSPNGAIFIGKTGAYLERGHFFGPRSIAFIMDKISSVDIDDRIDFLLAEAIINARSEGRLDV